MFITLIINLGLEQLYLFQSFQDILQHRFYINKIFEREIVNIFLFISFNTCFGCFKEPSHWDGSFEYTQHMFWLRNEKIIFFITHF